MHRERAADPARIVDCQRIDVSVDLSVVNRSLVRESVKHKKIFLQAFVKFFGRREIKNKRDAEHALAQATFFF